MAGVLSRTDTTELFVLFVLGALATIAIGLAYLGVGPSALADIGGEPWLVAVVATTLAAVVIGLVAYAR